MQSDKGKNRKFARDQKSGNQANPANVKAHIYILAYAFHFFNQSHQLDRLLLDAAAARILEDATTIPVIFPIRLSENST